MGSRSVQCQGREGGKLNLRVVNPSATPTDPDTLSMSSRQGGEEHEGDKDGSALAQSDNPSGLWPDPETPALAQKQMDCSKPF